MQPHLLRAVLGLCLAALAPRVLRAQAQPVSVGLDARVATLRAELRSPAPLWLSLSSGDTVARLRDPRSRGSRVALRAAGSFLVAVPGMYVGALAGRPVLPDHCNGCDDPGLEPTIVGGIVGAVTASALLAGALRLGDRCSTPARMQWALVGGVAGGGAVIATLYAAHHDGTVTGAALLSVPLAVLLPAFTSSLCESR